MRRDHKLRIAVGLLRGLCRRYSLMRNDWSQILVQERDSITGQFYARSWNNTTPVRALALGASTCCMKMHLHTSLHWTVHGERMESRLYHIPYTVQTLFSVTFDWTLSSKNDLKPCSVTQQAVFAEPHAFINESSSYTGRRRKPHRHMLKYSPPHPPKREIFWTPVVLVMSQLLLFR
jgi:hypothetical protein